MTSLESEIQFGFRQSISFDEIYPYRSAWIELPSKGSQGVLAPHARTSEKGWVYIAVSLEEALAGRELLVGPDILLNLMQCRFKGSDASGEECQGEGRALILNNGRFQDNTELLAVCENEAHLKSVMDGISDSYYDDDWDFMNPPVFGVYTCQEFA